MGQNNTNLIYGEEVFPLVPIGILAAIFHIFSAANDIALHFIRRVGRVAVMYLVKSIWERSWTGKRPGHVVPVSCHVVLIEVLCDSATRPASTVRKSNAEFR